MAEQTATGDTGVTGWIAAEVQNNLIGPIEDFETQNRSGGDCSQSCWGHSSWCWLRPAEG